MDAESAISAGFPRAGNTLEHLENDSRLANIFAFGTAGLHLGTFLPWNNTLRSHTIISCSRDSVKPSCTARSYGSGGSIPPRRIPAF